MVDEEGGAWQEPSFLPNDNPDEARLLRLKIKPSKAYFESEGPKRRGKGGLFWPMTILMKLGSPL